MSKIKIIAATGCPTGIAHTFMAAEALKIAAKKLGVEIKVETHGQVGIENALTKEEIREADGVIIAADKDVNADRFIGKPVVDVPVAKGIRDAETLISTIIEGKAKVYKPSSKQQADTENEEASQSGASIGRSIYKHLMNGVSHMLPFVVGGGVLIALSFLFGIHSANPDHESFNPTAKLLKDVGGLGFQLMVPILAAYIAESIAKRPGLVAGFIGGMIASTGGAGFLGGIVAGFLAGYVIVLLSKLFSKMSKSLEGLKAIFLFPVLGILLTGALMTLFVEPMTVINEGMMSFLADFQNANPIILGLIVGTMSAFDMGGPINKAAYVTGTALLAEGNLYFMAGVSAACITPPLVTAFAVVLFKKYFNQSERNAGVVNFILGSTHITEGAIPFAAKNPIVVIPILMVASSVSAILTYTFNVQVPAPHGGFLVLPVVTGAFKWVLAILIGSLVGAVAYGYSRKFSAQNNQVPQSEKISA
ncbi:PTS system fructose-specific IIC component [Bacillus pakistanensis]|uniref:PTS system fructose-specific IIC component n=1 Tax=Rossellomorea pakistanensis TaxID=992288 RepID=A0ABS2NI78_9BACI|nr:fructose-specific PTS transporter subunit EIIC [Bacillus pakistanensis]MBM7587246.1 PTS system fructose-specific IIC component [Bacillus pakistanensis]